MEKLASLHALIWYSTIIWWCRVVYYIKSSVYFWCQISIFSSNHRKSNFLTNYKHKIPWNWHFLMFLTILSKFCQIVLVSRNFSLATGMYQNKILKLDIEILPREKTNTKFQYLPVDLKIHHLTKSLGDNYHFH